MVHNTPVRLSPSRTHEYRRGVLDSLAILAGFEIELTLPDGSRPDVARVSVQWSRVFLGDAKHSESPADEAVICRLRRYALWLRGTHTGSTDVLALCHRSGQ